MQRFVLALGFVIALVAAGLAASGAAAQINAYPCGQARTEWAAVQNSTDIPALLTYRDRTPSACIAQRVLVETRLRELGALPTGRERIEYDCDGGETVHVTFDYDRGTAILSRYARRNVEMQRTETSVGVRYARGDQYRLEVESSALRIWVGESQRYFCLPTR